MKCSRTRRAVGALACAAVAVTLCATVSVTRAEAPVDPPVFSDPLEITNPYHPFPPLGEVGWKLLEVQQGHTDVCVLDLYPDETRTLLWGATPVECRVLVESEEEDGETTEISWNYFAQADDGTVYYLGETVDIYEGGLVVSHDGSWLVGGPEPGDPVDTATALDPAVFMPANPEAGDTWKPEDLFPIVDETVEALKVGTNVTVPAGKFPDTLKVQESSLLTDSTENKWYAPGVGVMQVQEQGEKLVLVDWDLPLP
jgi:hypothetical protein